MKIKIRLWILIIVLALSILAISPSFKSGLVIKSVEKNSTSYEQGLRPGQIIESINNQPVKNLEDYSTIINNFFNDSIRKKLTIQTNEGEIILFINQAPNITLGILPKSNIKTGLDLRGGARALIEPEVQLSSSEMTDLIAVTNNRLNVYGISDLNIRSVSDLEGNRFMLIEVAGATPADLEKLISQQGKFEAKISNESVFIGGERDITSICRNDASCAGIESCDPLASGGYTCRFRFTVYLSEEAAERHADITSKIDVNQTEFGGYLTEKLDLYVDDILVDSLFISEDLKGRVTTQIQVQGSGSGQTYEEALKETRENMNQLQTILITGSLPYKLNIVKLDTISPLLGSQFIFYILIAGLSAIIAVALIVFIRYRKLKISISLLLISFSEIIIILGIASFINWNLDIPSIAGILIVIGTGVDQQIIIADESRKTELNMVQRLKRALFIVIGAYFTTLASLLPLYWAGAGLLKGFAFTTIIGITVGVLITRPAFAELLNKPEN